MLPYSPNTDIAHEFLELNAIIPNDLCLLFPAHYTMYLFRLLLCSKYLIDLELITSLASTCSRSFVSRHRRLRLLHTRRMLST